MTNVVVRAQFLTASGAAARGVVIFTPRPVAVLDAAAEEIIATGSVAATLDVTGSIAVTLRATDDAALAPNGWTYQVREEIIGAPHRVYDISVPAAAAGAGIDLSAVAPIEAASGSPTAFLTASAYAAGTAQLYAALAALLDVLIVGAITRDTNEAATSAGVVWPDGTVGTYTALVVSSAFPGAVDSYRVTYGSPATRTYTQPTVTRDASGAVTTRPAITVA